LEQECYNETMQSVVMAAEWQILKVDGNAINKSAAAPIRTDKDG